MAARAPIVRQVFERTTRSLVGTRRAAADAVATCDTTVANCQLTLHAGVALQAFVAVESFAQGLAGTTANPGPCPKFPRSFSTRATWTVPGLAEPSAGDIYFLSNDESKQCAVPLELPWLQVGRWMYGIRNCLGHGRSTKTLTHGALNDSVRAAIFKRLERIFATCQQGECSVSALARCQGCCCSLCRCWYATEESGGIRERHGDVVVLRRKGNVATLGSRWNRTGGRLCRAPMASSSEPK